MERAGQEMMLAMRQQLYKHLLGRDESFFGRNPVGKLVTRLTNDIQNVNEMFSSALVSLFPGLLRDQRHRGGALVGWISSWPWSAWP